MTIGETIANGPLMNAVHQTDQQALRNTLVNATGLINSNNPNPTMITGIDYVSGQSGIDASTESLEIIDYAHHEIHSGNHYKAGFMDVAMSSNDTVELLFVTPNTAQWAHWTLVGQSTGAVKIEVFEGTIASVNGTVVTSFNRNRNSSNTSSSIVYHTPTVTNDGTKMVTKYLGSEGFKEDTGGEGRGDSEFLLKQNTKYLVRLTALSTGIVGAIGGDWYEHTNKN